MAAESALEKKCRLYAEKRGGRLVKLRSPGTRGFPDRLLILPDFVMFMEFKTPVGRLSPPQLRWITYLQDVHVAVSVVKTFAAFKRTCDAVKVLT